jgi:hypothetical protein
MRPAITREDSEAIGSDKRSNAAALKMSEDSLTRPNTSLQKSIAEQDENGFENLPTFCPVFSRFAPYFHVTFPISGGQCSPKENH